MKARIGWVVLGMFAYLIGMAALIPARQAIQFATPWLATQGVHLAAAGVDGRLWSGHAARVEINRRVVGPLSWQLSPWPLWRGRFGAAIALQLPRGRLRLAAAIGLTGTVLLNQAEGELPIGGLLPPGIPVTAAGPVQFNLADVRLQHGRLASARGTMVWRDATLTAPERLRLGDLSLRLSPRPAGGVVGQLGDGGGPLELSGTLTLLPNGRYHLDARLGARSGAGALARDLPLLGPPDTDGRVHLRFAGQL